MNATVSNALNTLESTLATLLDSVASYNPSPQAAAALVHADEQLTESLETRNLPPQS